MSYGPSRLRKAVSILLYICASLIVTVGTLFSFWRPDAEQMEVWGLLIVLVALTSYIAYLVAFLLSTRSIIVSGLMSLLMVAPVIGLGYMAIRAYFELI